MSLNTDWNVEQYRHDWDSDDQWEVRRQFMEAHINDIPEAKLVCLAQVYANIEFLQCSYPAKVMEQVKELASGLDESVLETRRQKQNIKFVKANEDKKQKNKVLAEKRSPPEHDNNSAKRTRWETPAESSRPQNRPTASSYFESGDRPDDSSPSTRLEPQSQYSSQQSYYTSTYYNRAQNQAASGNRGPGAHRDNCYGSGNFGNSNNARPDQNFESGTTTISGKSPANDGGDNDLLERFKRLVESVSDPVNVGKLDVAFLNNAAAKAKLVVKYDFRETPRVKKENPMFLCLVSVNDVSVTTTAPFTNKNKAKTAASAETIKKLQNAKVKIVKNDAGQLELITLDPGIFPDLVAVPGPLNALPPPEDLLPVARMHFANFVLIERADLNIAANPVSILYNSAQLNDRKIIFDCVSCPTSTTPHFWRCLVKIHNIAVGEGTGIKMVEAKRTAAAAALDLLRAVAFTLVVTQSLVAERNVSKDDFASGGDRGNSNLINEAISDDNVGNKLLRLMGWSGSGGLGKPGREGIAEPVKFGNCRISITGRSAELTFTYLAQYGLESTRPNAVNPSDAIFKYLESRATEVRGREGFGSESAGDVSKQFFQKAREVIGEYARTSSQRDLVFSSEFTKEERATLHKVALKHRLKSSSRGQGSARFLVISQPVDKIRMIEHLIEVGGSTEKYSVIPPSGKICSAKNTESTPAPSAF